MHGSDICTETENFLCQPAHLRIFFILRRRNWLIIIIIIIIIILLRSKYISGKLRVHTPPLVSFLCTLRCVLGKLFIHESLRHVGRRQRHDVRDEGNPIICPITFLNYTNTARPATDSVRWLPIGVGVSTLDVPGCYVVVMIRRINSRGRYGNDL